MKSFLLILAILGAVTACLSTPIAIGYCLYTWASGGVIAVAAWSAFKVWLMCIFGGSATYVAGMAFGVK